MAAAKGLHMALLPTWGDKFNKKWGEGPEIFTPENARAFGAFLGHRYRYQPVIWVLGGDRNPDTQHHLAIIRAMASGLEKASGGHQLMTYHPQGGSKSWERFKDDAWLDFHLFQSGHDHRDFENFRFTLEGRSARPAKPVIDGEPRYEDHPVGLFRLGERWRSEVHGWFGELDVRQAAWWSLLSGAAGHTHGNHNIWQMWQPPRQAISRARTPWKVALHHAGAAQMGHMRRFLEEHGFGQLEPAQELLTRNVRGAAHQRAARTRDGRTIIVYSPLGTRISLRVSGFEGARARWFNPRTAEAANIRRICGSERTCVSEPQAFDPPGEPRRGNDWVLMVERR